MDDHGIQQSGFLRHFRNLMGVTVLYKSLVSTTAAWANSPIRGLQYPSVPSIQRTTEPRVWAVSPSAHEWSDEE